VELGDMAKWPLVEHDSADTECARTGEWSREMQHDAPNLMAPTLRPEVDGNLAGDEKSGGGGRSAWAVQNRGEGGTRRGSGES
jgi:hypothetical protein